MRKRAFATIGAAFVASCSPTTDLPAGEKAIEAFHKQLNAGDFGGIYTAGGALMKGATSNEKMTQIFSGVHRKLGAFKSGKTQGWRDNVDTRGHLLGISYATQYERGEAEENFTFSFKDGKAVLEGYFVNSQALVIN